jgi:mannose-6-phosphate isomerase-like protein (cupin superfamily)
MKPGIVYSAESGLIEKEYRFQRGNGECFQLLTAGTYAESMTATEIHLDGDATQLLSDHHDTLVFIREGSAIFIIDEDQFQVEEGTALLVKSGSTFNWLNGKGLKAIEISIPDASGPFARRLTKERRGYQPIVKQGSVPKGAATADREFEVLFNAENGSSGATMFIGFIPPSGAPAHYHLYDEVCHIVRGGGELRVGDTIQEISAGSTFVVAPRLLHSIVNNRDEDLWILGTFRPEGSPAAAYYPDGRPAPGYTEAD